MTGFTEFYKNNHNGRVLNWDHSLGNATVKARFKAGQKELSVSLHQAVVVLLFNDEEKISFKSIKDQTSMGTLHILDSPLLALSLYIRGCGPSEDVTESSVR